MKFLTTLGKLAVSAAAGGLLAYGIVKGLAWLVPTPTMRLVFGAPAGAGEAFAKLGGYLLALWVALAAHELAHLLTGLALGFRFQLLAVGPLVVRRDPVTDRVRVGYNRDAGLWGGAAASVPVRQQPDLRQRLAAVVAAGPLASLLLAGVAIALSVAASHAPGTLATAGGRIGLACGLLTGLASLLLFAATTLPGRTGAFYSDRGRLFRLLGGGRAAEVEQATLELLAHSQAGYRFADLNPSQVALLEQEPQPFLRSFAHTLAYYRHLDRGEEEPALQAIRAAADQADGLPDVFRQEVWQELAFAEAYVARDLPTARRAWEQLSAARRQLPTVPNALVEAALALAGGQPADALLGAAHQRLPAAPTRSEHHLHRQLLTALLARHAAAHPA